jgi:hypothetical protein
MRMLFNLTVHHDDDLTPVRCRCDRPISDMEPLHVQDESANKLLFQQRHNICRDLLIKAFRKHPGIRVVDSEPVLPGQDDKTNSGERTSLSVGLTTTISSNGLWFSCSICPAIQE